MARDTQGAATGTPLTFRVSPVAGMLTAVALWTNSPGPLTSRLLPPGLAVVLRSTLPPVTLMAASVKPVDSSITTSRSVRLPPVTRMVGASVAVV